MYASIAYAIVMMIISYAISASMAPKPQNAVAGNLDVPTAKEGDSIPVIFGTVMVKTSNVIWYGDPGTEDIKSSGGKK